VDGRETHKSIGSLLWTADVVKNTEQIFLTQHPTIFSRRRFLLQIF
jgi:hypothetical protein